MVDYISPLKSEFPDMPAVAGVKLAAAHSGMKYRDRDDVILVELAEGSCVAGVFTKNTMCGMPVDWCRSILPEGKARGLVVNAGIANVFTGQRGIEITENTAGKAAEILGCTQNEIYVSSTGVIGELIDEDKLLATMPALQQNLADNNWYEAARAIMTTDTFPKGITRKAKIGDTEIIINGIIKGSGMIAPNMATMLGYVFTDAKIPSVVLQELLDEDVKYSYNCMTVDSDTSTSDTILVFATGKAEHEDIISIDAPALADFREKLREVHIELAKLVARDGEGITKFITVNVKGAETYQSAHKIAMSIANSPLVKTAVAGGDPNWGRIVMAIGKCGEPAMRDKTSIWTGGHLIAENGAKHPDYIEADAAEYMKGDEIDITVNVGVGDAEATVWTMDLTYDYIRINVDYRS